MPPVIPNVTITRELPKGDLCNLYEGTYEGASVIVKVAANKADNDLVQTETRMLRRLYPPTASDTKFYRYLSKLLASGTMAGGLAYNILAKAVDTEARTGSAEYVSMADVIRAYPQGIDYRDMAWMFKRALVVLGWVHQKNIVHGNITPPHILVHPIGHGGKIIDWSYAVLLKEDPKAPKPVKKAAERPTAWARLMDEDDETHIILEEEPAGPGHIKAITPEYGLYYPPEVTAKRIPSPATDLYMLAKCIVALLGGHPLTNQMPTEVPRQVRELLEECLVEDPACRHGDAWDLHDRFDAILTRLVGKPVYRPFAMPPAV